MILIVGHKGCGKNTIASFKKAINDGADEIEFDVRSTKDEKFIIIHEEKVKSKIVEKTNYEELKKLKRNLLLLEEVLIFLRKNFNKGIHLDYKSKNNEEELIKIIKKYYALNKVLFNSLHVKVLKKIKKIEPRARVAISFPEDKNHISEKKIMKPLVDFYLFFNKKIIKKKAFNLIKKSDSEAIMLYYKLITKELIDFLHSKDYKIHAWTVDDINMVRKLVLWGVDSITTNNPGFLKTKIKNRLLITY